MYWTMSSNVEWLWWLTIDLSIVIDVIGIPDILTSGDNKDKQKERDFLTSLAEE